MTEKNTTWLDDLVNKLENNEEVSKEQIDRLLNYVEIPLALNKQITKERIRYIDLIDNFELIDELPDNSLDTGGHEHLAKSVETANRLNGIRKLNKDYTRHLIADLTTPLEFIFEGVEEENFQIVLTTLLEKPSKKQAGDIPKKIIDSIMGETFKQTLYSIVKTRATETFMKKIREHIDTDNINKDTKEIREYLPQIDSFGYGNTKVENELAKPNRTLKETIKKIGFNVDLASEDDTKKGNKYLVTAKFTSLDDSMIPDKFNYGSSARKLVNAIGNAYDLTELETQVAGAKSVRVDHLINIMDQKPATTRVSLKRVQEVTEQIKVLRNVSVEIDAKYHKEYNAKKPQGPQLERDKFTGYLLPVEVIERKEFSKDKQVYISILKRPVLYEYAREATQVITVEDGLLDFTTYPEGHTVAEVDQIKRMTQQISVIGDFMILETRGRGRKKPYTAITYDRIYQYVDHDLGRRVRRQTLNSNIEKVAKFLIAKGEYKKMEILPKGKKQYGTLRLYKK